MPPKKRKGKKKKKKEKEQKEVEDELTPMTRQELEKELKEREHELSELRRLRNYYQLERDQIHQFYDVVHNEVLDYEAQILNLETEMENMKKEHKEEIKNLLSEVTRHMESHDRNLKTVRANARASSEKTSDDHSAQKAHLNATKALLKDKLKMEEKEYEDSVQQLKEEERRTLRQIRTFFEQKHKEVEDKLNVRLQQLKNDLELRRRMEMHEIEERKNKHINELMSNHERAFNEMRNYYNSITRENLEMIQSLKEQLVELKAKTADNARLIDEYKRKNETLSEPLAAVQQKVLEKKQELHSYEKDKVSLDFTSKRLTVLHDKYESLTQLHRSLQNQHKQVEEERNELYECFERVVRQVKLRTDLKNDVLERRLAEHNNTFEAKRAQFASLLRASDLDAVVVSSVTRELDDVITAKNRHLEDLQHESTRVQKMHNDLVRVFESKLAEFNVPLEERGLRSELGHTNAAPADLMV